MLALAAAMIATTTSATVVGAAGGWTAWSEVDGARYVLVTRAPDGTISRPAVAPRGVPFDLDLGGDADGRVVAAYSRCTTEPRLEGGANTIGPQWTSGEGCTIHVLDLATGAEREIPPAPDDASEVLPSVGGGSLAYVAVPRTGSRALLMVRDPVAGTARRIDYGRLRRAAGRTMGEGPTSVDTDGRRVASVWHFVNPDFASFDTDLRVQAFGAKRRTSVAGASIFASCKYETLLSPTLAGGSVFYLDTKGIGWALGRTPATRWRQSFGASSMGAKRWIPTSAAVDGTRLVIAETQTRLRGSAAGTTQIVERPLGRFAPETPVACG